MQTSTPAVQFLFSRDDAERRMNEEFGFHVEMETERLVRDAGLDPREARRRARAAFGGVEAHKEALRDGRGWAWLTGLTLDLKLGYRVLEKARGWTLVVLVSLALGIGANTALFSAVDGMLFRTLPVADPDGLVRLRWTGDNGAARNVMSSGSTGGMGVSGSFSYPVFEALRDANETLAGMLAATLTSLTLVVDGRAEMATGLAATGDYFRVLGVQPAAGRAIVPDDDRPGAEPVAMISHSFRERRFGPEGSPMGTVIRVNDVPTTIVGVLPPGYAGVRRPDGAAADVHLPLATLPLPEGDDRLTDATFWWLPIMGRLRPGVTPARVQGNLDGVLRAAAQSALASFLDGLTEEERGRARNRNRSAEPRLLVDSGRQGLYDANPRSSGQALVLGVVVTLVLLIVCANVATLLLSRAVSRQREVAIRMSVGATRGLLIRQLVTESLLLSAAGGMLALPVAWAARRLLPFGQTNPFYVVGVVRDTRYDDLRGAAPPTVFRSAIQSPLRSATFAVRTAGPPNALTPAVRESIRQIDPRLPIMNVTTQTAAIEERLSDERLFAVAYASFGGLATLLAAIGLFGLASYTVTRRTGEIGVRMALGAPSPGIAWMVLRESLVLVAAGVAAGVGTVLLAGRLVASLIHGLAPTDPVTILQAAALLAGIAAAAAYFPARRAARVDPLTALLGD